ncbi:MAG: transcription termination factor NusA [Candidatus Marinimicrobia bacterium]|nr:transcription termination factor NusA [Candidatus Neomarinimicrobiota bacterium]MBT3634418.1 transcription termination factor NusA [Candidatus Neomarinimicrobiota bacterium]MBT3683245.1 transcription termination factor NusA [Candidatus Neomarinimicrobiota bacterium]MBT3760133.1 transcription termination factor NusA [Candidatus Neomarinimicrobiota bacterium]MBT3896228.1 transcription termination factor NusA [Candidatus Neomarinimicrobiota bacterium]
MINKSIIEAFTSIAREKNVDRTNLGTIIEELFMTLIRKKYGEERENFSVIVNMEKGEIEIYQEMEVVEDVVDPVVEISLEDANKLESDIEVGDPFIVVIDPTSFGRRLINTAKQYLNQKIRDIEKESIFEEFKARVGEIAVGNVHQIQRDNVFVNIDKAEMLLPKSEQMINDRFRRGQTVRGIIKSVEWKSKGPQIILSRSSNDFLKRLFEMEIPEIEDEIIEIKKVSRVPGDRSKVVVFSADKRIDAVGACVGMRGSRIQAIVRELNGEKIDIVNWSKQPEILITRALSPAKPLNLFIDENRPYCIAVFEDEELPIAIGKNGQNIKLTSEITGYTIDAVKKSEYEGIKKSTVYLDELDIISKEQLESLSKEEIFIGEEFLDADRNLLIKLDGFDSDVITNIASEIQKITDEQEQEQEQDKEQEQSEKNNEIGTEEG